MNIFIKNICEISDEALNNYIDNKFEAKMHT